MLSFLAKWRHRSHSLTTRFIALAVSLFAVLQVVQLLSFTESVRTNAAIQQNQGFDLARKVLTSQLSQRQQMLTQSAQVLASDFGLRAAVSGNNVATIESALENHAQRIGAPVDVLLSPTGSVVASTLGESNLLDNMAIAFAKPAIRQFSDVD